MRSLLPIYIIIKDAQLVLGASEIIYLFLPKRINDKIIFSKMIHIAALPGQQMALVIF